MSSTGGAAFTPRLPKDKRPIYPPLTEVIWKTAKTYVRVPFLCTLATLGIEPVYRSVLGAAQDAGHSDRLIFTAITLLVHTVVYVSVNGFFYAAEANGWFEQYRFERKPYQRPSTALLLRTWGEAFVNQVITGPLVVWYIYNAFVYFGMPDLDSPLPDMISMAKSYALAHFFNDFFFFWAHRLFHAKSIYKHIHKQHHTYNGSIGFAAEFASPLEQVFANQLPSIGGCLFFGVHPLILWIWITARLQQTYEGHSGFCFYGSFFHRIGLTNSETAAYHDYHHSGNRGNFGSFWLDWICGTMDFWLALGGTEGYIEQCKAIRESESRSTRSGKSK